MQLFDLFENTLDMTTKARMARAKKLGFTVRAYHGTGTAFDEFSLDVGKPNRGGGHGPNFSDVAGEASGYADTVDGGNVIPVLLRIRNPYVVDMSNKVISADDFLAFTGGIKPHFWEGDSWKYTTRDVMDALFKHYNGQTGDHKRTWELVYAFFKKKGYDAFYFPDTPRDRISDDEYDADEVIHYHKKIVVFDPKNVRSVFAAFDPSQSNSANLQA